MGFSNTLKNNAVHEWIDFYVDYDHLYSNIRNKNFKKLLYNELEKVNNFYFLLEKKAEDEKDNIFTLFCPSEEFKSSMIYSEKINKRNASQDKLSRFEERFAKNKLDKHQNSLEKDMKILAKDDLSINNLKEKIKIEQTKDDSALNEYLINDSHKKDTKNTTKNIIEKILKGNINEKRKKEKNLTEFLLSLVKIIAFRDLNATGLLKLARKYTDIRKKSKFYDIFSRKLKDSYFYKSRRIDTIRLSIKKLYKRVFAQNQPEKAKKIFRLIKKGAQPSDWLLVFAGIFLGVAFSISFFNISLRHNKNFWSGTNIYLGFILFGFCLKIFKEYQINYKFIFHFDVCSLLNNSLYLLILSLLLLFHTISFSLIQDFNPKYELLLICLQLLLLFIPFDIFFYNSRIYLLGVYTRAITLPFSTIRFRHFYFIDIVQSFSFSIKNILILAGIKNTYILLFCTSFFTIIRVFQCLKRYSSSRLVFPHIINCFKFGLGIIVNFIKDIKHNNPIVKSSIFYLRICNSSFTLFWDIYADWIIKRNRYMFPYFVYIIFCLFDIFARFYWLYNRIPEVNSPVLESIVEVVRRFVWTLLRVEVEHLNNCNELKAKNAINLTAGELFYKKDQRKEEPNDTINNSESAIEELNEDKINIDDSSFMENESISGYNSETENNTFLGAEDDSNFNISSSKGYGEDYFEELSEYENNYSYEGYAEVSNEDKKDTNQKLYSYSDDEEHKKNEK